MPQPTAGIYTQPAASNGVQPLTGPLPAKDLSGGNYLKGTDLPEGINEVRFRIVQFVRDPRGRSRLVAQISETYGKSLFGFNVTNIKALASLGFADLQGAVGKTVIAIPMLQNNPQTGAPTRSLFVQRVEA